MHKAQWIHRRQSSIVYVTITPGERGPSCWARLQWATHCVRCSEHIYASFARDCCVLRTAPIVPTLLEGHRLTNGKHLMSLSPNLCFAIQISRHGYNPDLCHLRSSYLVLVKQKLLYCTMNTWMQRSKEVWKTSLQGGGVSSI